MSEKKLQAKIIKWLKENGAYVIKTKPGPGTPVGCPDIIALYHFRYTVIEVKADPSAPYQPGQQATLKFLRQHNPHVYRVDPTTWPEVQELLLASFF